MDNEEATQPVTFYLPEALAAKMGILGMDYEQACRHIMENFSIPLDLFVPPAWTLLRPVPQDLTDDPSAFVGTTCAPPTQEPFTFERMQRVVQELRDQYPEPPVEILSPTEYFRRTGFRKPLSEETLTALEPPAPLLSYLKRELIYGETLQQHMNITNFFLNREIATAEMAAKPLTDEEVVRLKNALTTLSTDPVWLISPKTHHQLLRLAARARRQHRAWLRKKRQRRARQRRHNRGGR